MLACIIAPTYTGLQTLDSEGGVLLGTGPELVWLGEDCDGHGDGTVAVHQPHYEEDPPEDDAPVLVHHDRGEGGDHGDCHDGLAYSNS